MREYQDLLLQRPRPGVLQVNLNRPDKFNALTFEMFDELTALCHDLEGDTSVRVVVLTGTGRGFCGGLDLEAVASLLEMSPFEFLRGQEKWAGVSLAIQRLTTPVIAAVNGPAAGAGFSLAMACDMRVAASTAKFNAAFIRVGLTGGDMGSTWLLPRLIGVGRANEILMTGRFVSSEEAERIGLVNRVVEPSALLDSAYELAETIMSNSPFGIRVTKQAVQTNLGAASLAQAIELENRNQALAASTSDMREALTAFLEKRPAVFTGE